MPRFPRPSLPRRIGGAVCCGTCRSSPRTVLSLIGTFAGERCAGAGIIVHLPALSRGSGRTWRMRTVLPCAFQGDKRGGGDSPSGGTRASNAPRPVRHGPLKALQPVRFGHVPACAAPAGGFSYRSLTARSLVGVRAGVPQTACGTSRATSLPGAWPFSLSARAARWWPLPLRQDPAGLASRRGRKAARTRMFSEDALRRIVSVLERADVAYRRGPTWVLARRLHEHACDDCGPAHMGIA